MLKEKSSQKRNFQLPCKTHTHARTRGKTTPRACLVDSRCVCQTDSRHWSGLSAADRSFARRECARSLIFFPQRRGHFVRSVLASGSGPDFRFRVFSFVGSFAAPVSCTVRGFRLCVRRRRPGIVLRASIRKVLKISGFGEPKLATVE